MCNNNISLYLRIVWRLVGFAFGEKLSIVTQSETAMGLFTFKTADTNETIGNVLTGHYPLKPVYLLQPSEQPIKEEAYLGYGVFGGVDAYAWLASKNIGVDDRELGIKLANAQLIPIPNSKLYILQGASNVIVEWVKKQIKIDVINFTNWDVPIMEAHNLTANQLSKLACNDSKIELNRYLIFPLKFSYQETAIYEDLPHSVSCSVL